MDRYRGIGQGGDMFPRHLLLFLALLLTISACGRGTGEDPLSGASRSPTPSPTAASASGQPRPTTKVVASPDPSRSATDPIRSNGSDRTTVRGRVTDQDGDPVERICVDLMFRVGDEARWYIADDEGPRTDGDGRYEGKVDTSNGGFKLRFRDCRHDPAVRLAFEWYDDATDVSDAKLIEPGAPATANAVLSPASSISGKVLDEDGVPIENVCVRLFDGTRRDGAYEQLGFYAPTQRDGAYAFTGLTAKTYRIAFYTGPYDTGPEADCSGGRHFSEWYNDHPYDHARDLRPETWPESDPVELGRSEQRKGIDAVLTACPPAECPS